MQRSRRGDQATENARHMTPRHGWKNALDCQGTNVERVWGSPWDVERAPRKWDGGVRNEQRKVNNATHDVGFKLSTIYTYTFQYLLNLHNETLEKDEAMSKKVCVVTYRDERLVLPAQYAQNGPDTQTCLLHMFDI